MQLGRKELLNTSESLENIYIILYGTAWEWSSILDVFFFVVFKFFWTLKMKKVFVEATTWRLSKLHWDFSASSVKSKHLFTWQAQALGFRI